MDLLDTAGHRHRRGDHLLVHPARAETADREPIQVAGKTFSATLSIGATLALPGESADTIAARADAAMYQAKLGDRNTVVRN
ncbi:MAG: diguanylate cyclase domain-containing protein [Mycobacterium sp.]